MSSASFAQDGQNKVMKQFNRPSITNAFITPQNNVEVSLANYFSSIPVPPRFDDRRSKSAIVSNELDNPSYSLAQQSRAVIGSIWGRDGQGNFHTEQLTNAAKYSSTDGQALTASASKDNLKVITQIAESLLKCGFVIAYDFNEILTYDQYYDQQDAKRRKAAEKAKTAFTPVVRSQEGWVVKTYVSIYRIVWNDSISRIFDEEMYVDNSFGSDRSQRIQKFDQFIFPLERVYSNFLPETTISSQSNDPKYYQSGLVKRLSMNELLEKVPEMLQYTVLFKSSKKIDEFKTRASVFNSYPTEAKIGTKEGVYLDERFFVYSIKLNRKGNEKKKREAVVRAYDISNNSKIATGDMTPTVFKQQGGKKIYTGYLVEMKEDRGIDIMLGQNVGNSISDGFYLGFDYRLSALTKKMAKPGPKFLRGLYFTMGISSSTQENVQLFELTDDGKNYIKGLDAAMLPIIEQEYSDLKYSCSTFGFYLGLSKELYVTKRGRISISPELGLGIFSMTATPSDTNGVSVVQDVSSMGVTLGAKIGVNLFPSMEIFAKPMLNYTLPSSIIDYNSSGELLTNSVLYSDYQDGLISTPLEKLSTVSGYNNTYRINFPITIGVRFKF
jgi:hypothetical protein